MPAQFLTEGEGDLLMDLKRATKTRRYVCIAGGGSDAGFHSPYVFNSLGPNSGLSSPVQCVAGSTETECDNDYLAGLTRQMDHPTLNVQDDVWKSEYGFHCDKPKSWAMSGSLQSTQCSRLGGFGCKNGCPSQLPSPRYLNRREATLHMLYAAAGEVARTRMLEQGRTGLHLNRPQFETSQKPISGSVPLNVSNSSDFGFHSDKYISYKQLQAAQFQKLKQQQMMKQQENASAWGQTKGGVFQYHQQKQSKQMVPNRGRHGGGARPLGGLQMPTATGNNLQQSGSGMRAVFLGNHGTDKRERVGTGVFLPRRVGTGAEPRKNPGCSTVLLPERVVKALNLNLETIDAQSQLQPRYEKSVTPDYDAADVKNPSSFLMNQQRYNAVNAGRPQTVVKNEVWLAQEWTY